MPKAKPKKIGRPTNRSRAGRPTVMTEKILYKLQQAYLCDATDAQACLNAGIHLRTLHGYQAENPDFLQRKHQWKQAVNLRAKMTIAAAVHKDADLSLKVLERREKDGYSTKVEHDGNFTFNTMKTIKINGKEKHFNVGEPIKENGEDAE
jgi:hypothetical protein